MVTGTRHYLTTFSGKISKSITRTSINRYKRARNQVKITRNNFDIDTFIKVGSIYAEKTTPTGANPIFMIMVNLMRGISTPEGVEAIDQYRASLPAASLFKNIGNHPLTRSVSAS